MAGEGRTLLAIFAAAVAQLIPLAVVATEETVTADNAAATVSCLLLALIATETDTWKRIAQPAGEPGVFDPDTSSLRLML